MALPADRLPALRVIDGGSPAMRQDEARIEAVAFMDEAVDAANEIVHAVTGLPVPSMWAIEVANKLASRATKAKAELLALSGPTGDNDHAA